MGFFEELKRETATERDALLAIPLLREAPRGNVDRESYVAFLGQAYHHVKHTVPLLMLCGARLPERLEWLRVATAHYISEEVGHQEWILDDLRACGADAEAVRRGRPAPPTELMVSYAYDVVQRGNPVAFFGMVHVLEGTSTELASAAAEGIRHALGLPRQAFSYLTSHGALDVSHVDFFHSLMDRLEDAGDREAVVHSARMFYRLYGDIFRYLERERQARAA